MNMLEALPIVIERVFSIRLEAGTPIHGCCAQLKQNVQCIAATNKG